MNPRMHLLTNILMDGTQYGSVSVGCEYLGARYHIWLDPVSLLPNENTLYKNPLLATPGAFRCKRLAQDRGVGIVLVPQLIAAAPGLLVEHKKRLAQEAAVEQQKFDEHRKAVLVAEAGGDLLEALRSVLCVLDLASPGASLAFEKANAAISKATGVRA